MKFEKGRKKTGGTPVGFKSEKTLEWEEFGRQMMEIGMPRMIEMMQNSDDIQFSINFNNLLEYFKPKLSRVESSGTQVINLNVSSLSDIDLMKLAE